MAITIFTPKTAHLKRFRHFIAVANVCHNILLNKFNTSIVTFSEADESAPRFFFFFQRHKPDKSQYNWVNTFMTSHAVDIFTISAAFEII